MSDVSDVKPPDDADEWTDDQWIQWLKDTDAEATEYAERRSPTARRITQSAPGLMIGQAMLGMAQAIYGHHDDDVVIVVDSGSAPGEDEPFRVHLDQDHPERSSIAFHSESPDEDDEGDRLDDDGE